MTSDVEVLTALKRKLAAADAVRKWMNDEGRAGNLRQNCQAPGWPEYEAAERAWGTTVEAWWQERKNV